MRQKRHSALRLRENEVDVSRRASNQFAIPTRREAYVVTKDAREVRLVRKPAVEGDVRQWRIRSFQFTARFLDFTFSDVVTRRAP